jgi:Lrp/AsnC family leucine-responsive transcriptional regulator
LEIWELLAILIPRKSIVVQQFFETERCSAMNIAKVKIDRVDQQILDALQHDARLSSAELADLVSLTPSPCWRRVKRLEESGVISGYHAKLDPGRLGYQVLAFIHTSLEPKTRAHLEPFERAVMAIPQVLAVHKISGRYDYQLMVVGEDVPSFGVFLSEQINSLPNVKEVYTSFVLQELKAPVSPPRP